jgi:RHS repeat-associated protein
MLGKFRLKEPRRFAWSRHTSDAKQRKLVQLQKIATDRHRNRYNGFEQLISRVITNSGTANGTTYFVHDLFGNVIAELTTAGATVREYIYLPEAEIAPTRQARTQVDRPVAVIDGVNTATPVTLMVHVDHLNRPVRMTNSAKASVWDVVYTPWGAFHSATGAQTLNTRFPGQWFQLESGLHYNWHRHYDPSLGRYTQPDPLGFVDGPSVYAYAKGSPHRYVDRDGRVVIADDIIIGAAVIGVGIAIMCMSNTGPPKKKNPPIADNDNRPPPPPSDYCSLKPGSGQSVAGGVQCTYVCQGGTIVPQTQPGPLCVPFIKRPFWAD